MSALAWNEYPVSRRPVKAPVKKDAVPHKIRAVRSHFQRGKYSLIPRRLRMLMEARKFYERITAEEANDLMELWRWRECFVCGGLGICLHREPAVDLARLQGRRAA